MDGGTGSCHVWPVFQKLPMPCGEASEYPMAVGVKYRMLFMEVSVVLVG